jgi:hypothetical protein
MAPKKQTQTTDQAGPSTHSPTPSQERDNLQQQIEHLVALNIEQQARQQAFEDRVMALFDRLAPTPTLTPSRTPNPEQSNEQKTQTQHTQEDVLQAVYAGLRLNATGAEIFPHRHHLKQQHKQQAGAWEQIQQTTYPLHT